MYCTDTPQNINNIAENEPFAFQPARSTADHMTMNADYGMAAAERTNTLAVERVPSGMNSMPQNMSPDMSGTGGKLGSVGSAITAPGSSQNGFLSNASRQTVDNLFGSNENIPETVTNPLFWPAYLRKFIGQWVRVDFFIGNSLEERIGQLIEVGASYIVLNVLEPETVLICDIFSIKFVTVVFNAEIYKLY